MQAKHQRRDVVAIGGSMGAIEALRILLAGLPEDLAAAILVVVHRSSSTESRLSETLDVGPLPARDAVDGDTIEHGHIYVAPADHHLLVSADRIRVTHGPRENLVRPAIDALFRSAAVYCGSRVTGVLLSGLLSDGAAGLAAIKRCGGVAVVQSPSDAMAPDLPENGLATSAIDHVVPAAQMADLIVELVASSAPPGPAPPRDLRIEAQLTEKVSSDIDNSKRLGSSPEYGCPACGGPLWTIEDSAGSRYRCHVGHGYSGDALLDAQEQAIESALWVAYRTLQDRLSMLERSYSGPAGQASGSAFGMRIDETQQHLRLLRTVLLGAQAGD